MRTQRTIHLLAVASAAMVGLVACGSDDSSSSSEATVEETSNTAVDRSASADDTTCPEQSSWSFDGHIKNMLPRGVKLTVPRKDWTCDDWSGVSTPARALNDMYLASGARKSFQLEPGRADARFTLRFDGSWMENFTEMTISGDIRLKTHIERFGSGIYNRFEAAIESQAETWRGSELCTFAPITAAPSSWSNTPTNEIVKAFKEIRYIPFSSGGRLMVLIVDKGRIGLVFQHPRAAILSAEEQPECGFPGPADA